MSLKTMLEAAFVRIGTEFKSIRVLIGGTGTSTTSGLLTTATNLVDAVNEVRATAGNAVTSVNGTAGPGAVVIDTDDVAEGATNLYFTQPRVRTTPLTGYTSGAGTVAATDTVLQAIQKLNGNIAALDTDDVPEGPTNLYFTNARAIAAPLAGYTSGAGTISSADTILQAIQKLNGNQVSLIDDVTPATDKVYSSTKTDAQIATAVANLVNSAPGALDQLNELAAAIGNDANYAATVTNALALKANIANTYSRTELGANLDTYDFEAVFVAALA